MFKIRNAVLFSTISLFALSAHAAHHESGEKHDDKSKSKMMETYDTDKNGSLSMDEFSAYSQKKFMKMDSDKNGEISQEEYKKHHSMKGPKHGKPMHKMQNDKM